MAHLFLEVDNTKVTIEAQKIGKGSFSAAYKPENLTVKGFVNPVLIVSSNDDTSKEVMTHLSGEQFFPLIEHYGEEVGTGKNVWVMEHYNKLTKKDAKPESWAAYQLLNKAWKSKLYNNLDLKREAHKQNVAIMETLPEDSSIREAVDFLYSWSSSYGEDMLFEFNKANMGLDNEGNLILRDPVFSVTQLQKVRR